MNESMKRFAMVCQETHVPIVLIFTKRDLFVKNLDEYAVPTHLPHISESTDPDTFVADTFQFFGTAFRSLDHRNDRKIYVYWINAINTWGIASIFQDLRDDVFERRQARNQPSTNQHSRGSRRNFTAWSAQRYKIGEARGVFVGLFSNTL